MEICKIAASVAGGTDLPADSVIRFQDQRTGAVFRCRASCHAAGSSSSDHCHVIDPVTGHQLISDRALFLCHAVHSPSVVTPS